MNLIWEDTKDVILDRSMHFGNGYDFFGMECLREEAETPEGRFMIWPEYCHEGWHHKFALYGGNEGWYQTGFKSREEAKNEVEKLVKFIIEESK